METEVSNELYRRLLQILLIVKEKDNSPKVQANVLAMMGLAPDSFPGDIFLSWDAEEILVQTMDFQASCTCATNPGLKLALVNGERHADSCDLARRQAILQHPCLTEVERDDDTITWTFQWPREIVDNRDALKNVFHELSDDILWNNFITTWKGFAVLMDDPKQPYSERMQADMEQEAALDAEAESVVLPDGGSSYDDDLDLLDSAPVPEFTEDDQPVDDAPSEESTPEPPKKRGPGRPPKKKPESKELSAADFTPTPDGKPIPALVKFAQYASEELGNLCSMINSLTTIDHFPFDTIESIKNSFDRLANRTAHLQYKGKHDANDPGSVNVLLEVTLCNVSSIVNNAVRDLSLSPERAESWKTFADEIKIARDKATSAEDIMGQPGAGPAIQDTPAPVEGDGRSGS
jgi:hypothetical protein